MPTDELAQLNIALVEAGAAARPGADEGRVYLPARVPATGCGTGKCTNRTNRV